MSCHVMILMMMNHASYLVRRAMGEVIGLLALVEGEQVLTS